MKKLCVLIGSITFLGLSMNANPVFKNRKAQNGDYTSNNTLVTNPNLNLKGPSYKNYRGGLDYSESFEVINPASERLIGPEFKNRKVWSESEPTIEVGKPMIIDSEE